MKSVLITGCSTGLGHYMAKEFLNIGYIVHVTGRKKEALKSLEDIGAITHELNLSSSIDIKEFCKKIDKLDILINNAGYSQVGPLMQLDDDKIKKQFQINLFSPLLLIRNLVPILLKSNKATIVNIGSMSGIMATPFAGAYCSSKAAINIFTDVLRMELSSLGIKVVKVLPGVFKSSFGDNAESRIIKNSSDYYNDLNITLKKRAQASQVYSSKTDVVAKKIVKKIIKSRTSNTIFVAKGAILAFITGRFIPNILKDKIFKKNFNL